MNNLLTKCLKELGEQSPRLDYVRGILETLIEANLPMKSLVSTTINFPEASPKKLPTQGQPQDEVSLMEANARAMMAKIPPQPQEL